MQRSFLCMFLCSLRVFARNCAQLSLISMIAHVILCLVDCAYARLCMLCMCVCARLGLCVNFLSEWQMNFKLLMLAGLSGSSLMSKAMTDVMFSKSVCGCMHITAFILYCLPLCVSICLWYVSVSVCECECVCVCAYVWLSYRFLAHWLWKGNVCSEKVMFAQWLRNQQKPAFMGQRAHPTAHARRVNVNITSREACLFVCVECMCGVFFVY